MRPLVVPSWETLAATVPGVSVRWSGSLRWPAPGVSSSEIARLEPHLRTVPPSARFELSDGGVDPVAATRALLVAARALGARIVSGATVTAVRDGEVESTAGRHPASTVVVAAGVGTAELCPMVTAPASPAFLMRMRAQSGLVRTVVATKAFEVREAAPGHLLATAPLGADRSWTGLRSLAGQTLESLRDAFGPGLRLTGWSIGDRPMPPDGPVIGYVSEGVYVAVMHSGICLAPAAGRLIAQEIVTGREAPELSGSHPRGDVPPTA
ncbi:NAD(P)/FAD-dependent oxidoreductase [Actinoplanes sp. CA-142083]|uniref:NAD(P)/FAD-dependent oxidoreductase n=1 Tax=Actinoplanes sp. CA-142083 TaxID=3239903 RepID=UPI003D8E4025